MWTEKYRPKVLSEVAGNDDLRGKINQWLRTWDSSFIVYFCLSPSDRNALSHLTFKNENPLSNTLDFL